MVNVSPLVTRSKSTDYGSEKMKIAFPSQENLGLESPIYGHFGTAGYFIVVDSANGKFETLSNSDRVHEHGGCRPLAALGGKTVEAVVVGGIGMGALRKLKAAGIRVYRAAEGTISENLALIQSGKLPEYTSMMTCAGHGGECAH